MSATIQVASESVVMTDDAQELLGGFVSGLSGVIYELSEAAARNRLSKAGKTVPSVVIETADVLCTRDAMMAFLTAEVGAGRLPSGVLSAFDSKVGRRSDMASPSPNWRKQATEHVDQLRDRFHSDLRAIARALAKHENAETVLKNHVDAAFKCLARAGLTRRVWWKRAELEVGIGSFLFALALASPDVLNTWFPDHEPFVRVTMLVLGLSGAGITVHGWFRGLL